MPSPVPPCLMITCPPRAALLCVVTAALLSASAVARAQDTGAPATPAPTPANPPAPAPILLPQPDRQPDRQPAADPPVAMSPRTSGPAATSATVQPSPRPANASTDGTPVVAQTPIAPDTPVSSADAADLSQPGELGTPTATSNETAVAEAAPAGAPLDGGTWPWLAGGIAALLAVIGGWWLWRRRRAPLALPAAQPPVDAPLPPATQPPANRPDTPAPPATPPSRPRAPAGQRAELAVRLEPLSASSTLVNFRMRYAVVVTNGGVIDAHDCALRIGLFAGTQASERGVLQWLMLDGQEPHHHVAAIGAGGEHRFEGELAAPLDALGAMDHNGRKLAIALVALDLRYHHPADAAVLDGQTARALVVGREPGNGSAKLAPFRIDLGPTSFAPLGVRDTRIGHLA